MAVAPRPAERLTAAEYFASSPEQHYIELIDGEIVVNEPNIRHNRIGGELYRLIRNWCEAGEGRGDAGTPADFHLDEFNVFAPDVWWVREERRPARDAVRLVGPPDLAVEVRSPSTWRFAVGTKKRIYEATGLPELWLVDTKADAVLVYRRSSPESPVFDVELELAAGEQLTTPLLPGLSIDLTELFDR